jgi:hypothetical protein
MQFTKDTFYLALRDRLAALNPDRKVAVDGVERPAVLVVENEPANAAPPLPNAYYVRWGAPQIVAGSEARRPLMKMECRIAYCAAPALAGGVDRGRALAALDSEILRLCTPPRTPKLDAAIAPPALLDTFVFWGMPAFEETMVVPPFRPVLAEGGDFAGRAVKLTVFFFPEVEQA